MSTAATAPALPVSDHMCAIVLMYHDVIEPGRPQSSGFPAPDASRYKLTTGSFRAHLEAMRAAGPRVAHIGSPREMPPSGSVLLTFDDGGVSSYDPIAGLLEDMGWRGHFFIATDFLGTPGFISASQVRDLRRRGHAIGAHSCSHPAVMSGCGWQELLDEWRGSLDTLAGILGEPVWIASVPGGYYAPRVAEAAAQSGIRVLFTSEPIAGGWFVNDCHVLGRFTMTCRTSAAQCAALASGRRWPQWKQQCLWGAKKIVKRTALPLYLRLRARALGGN